MEQREAVVVGAGAIGIVVADALATAGLAVTVLGGRRIDSIVLEDGDEMREHPVTHLAEWDGRPGSGPLVVAVKAHHTASVGALIAAAASSASAVVVAQNGIEHRERVAPFTGTTPIVPLLAYTPAERTAPGRAVLRRTGGRELVAPDDAAAVEVADPLRAGGLRVETVTDFATEAWRKLLTNVAGMTATTLTDRPQDVMRDPEVAAFAARLAAEAAVVARLDAAAIGSDEPQSIIRWLQDLPTGTTTSMQQDRRAGRPLEWDAIHGAVLRAAARHDVEAPLVRSAAALIAALRP